MPLKLSVVLAVYNEAAYLDACLTSVKGLADEIIVVDGSSQDNTREIAGKHRARVFKVSNQPMFHLNKQLAVDKAQGRWILQLDADEQVSPALKQEIKTTLANSNAKFNGYYLPRKNFFLTRFLTKGGQYPDYVIRLFKNHHGHFPCQSVHEQIVITGPVGYLKNPLTHYADREFSRYLLRFNRYTTLDAVKLSQADARPSLINFIKYCLFKPWSWFFSTYFRHLGLVDGLPGFIFSLMSALRFPVIYFKFLEQYHARRV